MAVAGIIAEYNPFHRGHEWQLAEVRRRLGAETGVVVCMSGDFVQRGDFAVMNKFSRAETALLGGADLVLELPMPWSAASAERFAQGGTAVLAATGVVTHLAFGCESGNLKPLQTIAGRLESQEYQEKLKVFTAEGKTFAAARQAAIRAMLGGTAELLSQPNNILAVEYLRALRQLESGIEPLALPRIGAGHDSRDWNVYPSASAVREKLLTNGNWHELLSESSVRVLSREMEAGRAPVRIENCQRAVLAQLRRMPEDAFLPYDGGNEGLYHRFYRAVRTEKDLTGILQTAKTKRYPLARLRRMLLQCYLGVPQAAQGETPVYLRVLGANETGRVLLGQMRKTASLPVITKPGHVRRLSDEVQRAFEQEARCADLYALAYPDLGQAIPEGDYAAAPVML